MADMIRLQKYLADAGVCSRRKAELFIQAGRVSVNGAIVDKLGTKVNPESDEVAVDGNLARLPKTQGIVVALNKPRGYITSTSSRQGKTVYELVPQHSPRLLPVGRLDKDSEGLLLLTNRNELVSLLTHPRYQHEKHYQVTVSGPWSKEVLVSLNKPMHVDGMDMSARVRKERTSKDATKRVLEFILTEGKNRQIRRMCEAVGLKVHRLFRTRFARISVHGIEPGEWRELTPRETASLDKNS